MKSRYDPFDSPDSSPVAEEEALLEEVAQRPLLLTVKEAAALIGIGRTTLYRLMDAGEIDSVHIGSSRRIALRSVYDYVDRLTGSTIRDLPRRGQA